MKLKKAVLSILAAGALTLSGCSFAASEAPESAIMAYDYSNMKLVQFDEPYEGQPIAVIETTKGIIKAALYPEYAPNMVDNFISRAKEGFYNGKDVFALVENAFFLTGAYNEEGTQGFTNDGNPIENEYSVNLWPFKGALCAYNGTAGYGDSRFFILSDKPLTDEEVAKLREIKNEDGEQLLPEELINAFVEKGSVAAISGFYTVFGQTIEGIEVVEAICTSEADEKTGRPVETIKLESVTITEYHTGEVS